MPAITVKPYSQERGKCWLTPDGQFYYGDCLDKETHMEIPPQPSRIHTIYDPITKTWSEDLALKETQERDEVLAQHEQVHQIIVSGRQELARITLDFLAAILTLKSQLQAAKSEAETRQVLASIIDAIPDRVVELRAELSSAQDTLDNLFTEK